MAEHFDTIVVAFDFSETSEAAWAAACRLAVALNSQIHLLHVSPDPLPQAWAIEAAAVDFAGMTEAWRQQAAARLAAVTPLAGLDEARITRVVTAGVPHRVVTEYASGEYADLIVVGTHGYGPVKHLLLGSVAERIVRHAGCPVLTVPHRTLRQIATPHRASLEGTTMTMTGHSA